MTQIVEGKVYWIADNAKFGSYGAKIEGLDGFINFKDKPSFPRGSVVKVQVKKGKKGNNYDVLNHKVLEEGDGTSGRRSGGSGGGSGGGGGKYERVDWNAATARAIEAADLIIQHGAVKLGAANKPQERMVQILGLIDTLTVKFFKDLMEQRPLKDAAETDDDLGEDAGDEDGDFEGEGAGDEIDWD